MITKYDLLNSRGGSANAFCRDCCSSEIDYWYSSFAKYRFAGFRVVLIKHG